MILKPVNLITIFLFMLFMTLANRYSYGFIVDNNKNEKAVDSLIITFTEVNNISCFGKNDGSVSIEVINGIAPFQYYWSNPVQSNSNIANNLYANIEYSVTVIDALNNSGEQNIILSQPDSIQLHVQKLDVICGNRAGSCEIFVTGGTAPFTYNWNTGDTLSNITNLPINNYTVTITDINQCQNSTAIEINEFGEYSGITEILQPIKCFDDTNAIAYAKLPNATPPINYLWLNNFEEVISTKDTVEFIKSGEYTIIATDSLNCMDTMHLTIKHPNNVHPNFNIIHPSCSSVADGQIMTNATGGNPPYTYLWSTQESNKNIKHLTEGYYTLTINDIKNCTYNFNVELVESEYCLIIHNTITPNGDGYNDYWIIENIQEFPQAEILIFDRNGSKIFQTTNYINNWNGTYKNTPLPEGTYFYIVDPKNGNEIQKGYLTILR